MYTEKTHKLIYNKGDIYSVTIQPDDQMQGFNSPKRYQDFKSYYQTKLQRLMPDSDQFSYYFTIELSEPIGTITSPPRLHLHGVIQLHHNLSIFKWLCDIMPDLLIHARLEVHHIDTLDKLSGWQTYIKKQQQYMPQKAKITNKSFKQLTPCESKTGGSKTP